MNKIFVLGLLSVLITVTGFSLVELRFHTGLGLIFAVVGSFGIIVSIYHINRKF